MDDFDPIQVEQFKEIQRSLMERAEQARDVAQAGGPGQSGGALGSGTDEIVEALRRIDERLEPVEQMRDLMTEIRDLLRGLGNVSAVAAIGGN